MCSFTCVFLIFNVIYYSEHQIMSLGKWSSFQIVAFQLFGILSLPEPILKYCILQGSFCVWVQPMRNDITL